MPRANSNKLNPASRANERNKVAGDWYSKTQDRQWYSKVNQKRQRHIEQAKDTYGLLPILPHRQTRTRKGITDTGNSTKPYSAQQQESAIQIFSPAFNVRRLNAMPEGAEVARIPSQSPFKDVVAAPKNFIHTFAIFGDNEEFVIRSARNLLGNIQNVLEYNPSDLKDVEIVLKVDDYSREVLKKHGYLDKLRELGVRDMTLSEMRDIAIENAPKALGAWNVEKIAEIQNNLRTYFDHAEGALKMKTKQSYAFNATKHLDKWIAGQGQLVISNEADAVVTSFKPSSEVVEAAKTHAYVVFSETEGWTPSTSTKLFNRSDNGVMCMYPNMEAYEKQIAPAANSIRATQNSEIRIFSTDRGLESWRADGKRSAHVSRFGDKMVPLKDVMSTDLYSNWALDHDQLNDVLLKGGIDQDHLLLPWKDASGKDKWNMHVNDLMWAIAAPFGWFHDSPYISKDKHELAVHSMSNIAGGLALRSDGKLVPEACTLTGIEAVTRVRNGESWGQKSGQKVYDAAMQVKIAGEKMAEVDKNLELSFDDWLKQSQKIRQKVLHSLVRFHEVEVAEASRSGQEAFVDSRQANLYSQIDQQEVFIPHSFDDIKHAVEMQSDLTTAYDNIYYQYYIIGTSDSFLSKSLGNIALNIDNMLQTTPSDVRVQIALDKESINAINKNPRLKGYLDFIKNSGRAEIFTLEEMRDRSLANMRKMVSQHISVQNELEDSVKLMYDTAYKYAEGGQNAFAVDLLRMIGWHLNSRGINIKTEVDATQLGGPNPDIIRANLDGNMVTTTFFLDNIPAQRGSETAIGIWYDFTISSLCPQHFNEMLNLVIAQADHLRLMQKTRATAYPPSASLKVAEHIDIDTDVDTDSGKLLRENAIKLANGVEVTLYDIITDPKYKFYSVYGSDMNRVLSSDISPGFAKPRLLPHEASPWVVNDFLRNPNIMTYRTWLDFVRISTHNVPKSIIDFGVSTLEKKICIDPMARLGDRCWTGKKINVQVPPVSDNSVAFSTNSYDEDNRPDLCGAAIDAFYKFRYRGLTKEVASAGGDMILSVVKIIPDAIIACLPSGFDLSQGHGKQQDESYDESNSMKIAKSVYDEILHSAEVDGVDKFLNTARTAQQTYIALLMKQNKAFGNASKDPWLEILARNYREQHPERNLPLRSSSLDLKRGGKNTQKQYLYKNDSDAPRKQTPASELGRVLFDEPTIVHNQGFNNDRIEKRADHNAALIYDKEHAMENNVALDVAIIQGAALLSVAALAYQQRRNIRRHVTSIAERYRRQRKERGIENRPTIAQLRRNLETQKKEKGTIHIL